MIDEVLDQLRADLEASMESIHKEFSRVRTGRASPSLLDGVLVDYYGAKTALNQLATVNCPEPRLLVVTPFDKNSIADIDRAVTTADLGLNPINDGKVVRIPIPELTEERRRELVRHIKKISEDFRISIRNHRRDANDMLKELLKAKEIAEDDHRQGQERVQSITDDGIKRVDGALKSKEEEIMAV